MVEDVVHKLHREQIKSYNEKPQSSSFQATELDGKMDKKQFLAYVEGWVIPVYICIYTCINLTKSKKINDKEHF